MQKPELWVLLLLTVLMAYMSYSLFYMPPQSFSNLDNLLPNTYLTLSGTPQDIRYYDNEVRFFINGTQIRYRGAQMVQNRTLTVEGYVSRYKDMSWIQALKIKYAS